MGVFRNFNHNVGIEPLRRNLFTKWVLCIVALLMLLGPQIAPKVFAEHSGHYSSVIFEFRWNHHVYATGAMWKPATRGKYLGIALVMGYPYRLYTIPHVEPKVAIAIEVATYGSTGVPVFVYAKDIGRTKSINIPSSAPTCSEFSLIICKNR